MVTYYLQLLVVFLKLPFSAGCYVIARRSGNLRGDHRAGWYAVAVCYGVTAVHGLIQNLVGGWAIHAGRSSLVSELYVRYQMAANTGRGFAMAGFAMLLLWLIARGRLAAAANSVLVLSWLAAWIVVGSLWGLTDTSPGSGYHHVVVTYTSAATVLLMMVALWLAIGRDAMDHLLWLALTIYTIREVVDVSITTAYAYVVTGAWAPSFSLLQWMSVLSYVLMLGCVARRMALIRGGREVPSLSGLLGGMSSQPAPVREPRL